MDPQLFIAPLSALLAFIGLSVQISRNRREASRANDEKQAELARRAVTDLARPTLLCASEFFRKDDGIAMKQDLANLKETTEKGMASLEMGMAATHKRLDTLINGGGGL